MPCTCVCKKNLTYVYKILCTSYFRKEGHILSVFALWKESLNSLKRATTSSNCTQKKSMSCLVGVKLVNGIATYNVFVIKMILCSKHVNIDMYCIIYYVLQHSAKYTQYFLSNLMGFICDKQPELRQAAAYGIGVMAKFGGDVYASTCAGNITKW